MKKYPTLSLHGALTIAHGQAERQLLFAALQEPARDLAVDLAGVDAFDTVGLELLLVARRHVAARGGRLILQGAGHAVTEVLAEHGLEALIGIKAEP